MRSWITALAAAATALLMLAAAGALFGHRPLDLLSVLVNGSVGSTVSLHVNKPKG